MASADDPLPAASSAPHLLSLTLGPAASPSSALDALLDGISQPLKGSGALAERAKLALKERGDIRKLYQDDGTGAAAAAAAANAKNNPQGRRPGMDRKRARFSVQPTTSKPAQNVDFSSLLEIEDPSDYFSTLVQYEKADEEIRRLRGDVPVKRTACDRVINPPMERRPGMDRRKSVHSYKFNASIVCPDAIEAPVSQGETVIESQLTEDDLHASVPSRTKEPVPSISSEQAVLDDPDTEDSFADVDQICTLNYLLSSFKTLNEDEGENLLRKALKLKETSLEKVCLPDFNANAPGDMPMSSTTVQKSPSGGHTPERSMPGILLDQFSQLERQIFAGDAPRDNSESDGSPESAMCKQSLARSSSDAVVLMAGKASTTNETPSLSVKSPEHVLVPETNLPKGVTTDETQQGNTPSGVYRDSGLVKEKKTPSPSVKSPEHVLVPEVNLPKGFTTADTQQGDTPSDVYRDSGLVKENNASCRHNVSLEEDDGPVDCTEVSSPNDLEGSSEMLTSTPGRNVSPLHSGGVNFIHQEMAGGDVDHGVTQDKPSHPLQMPQEDTDPHNHSDMHDGNIEKLAANISNTHSPRKDKGKRENKKQLSKRRVEDKPSHPLEMPPEDNDPHNHSDMHDGNIEKLPTNISNTHSPSKDKRERKNKKQLSKRGKKVADKPSHPLQIPPEDTDLHNHSDIHDGNIEKLPANISNTHSPRNDNRKRKNKHQLSTRGKRVSGVRSNPLEMSPQNSGPENQPHLQETNVEQQTACTSRSPSRGKVQKEAQRRNKKKELNGRKSLADAGLNWQSGVRRSTRVRTRPLQHWLGERLVFGRIHNSLPTVIGIKSLSPSQEGKAELRVKSLVPEQYADLLDRASRY